MFMVEVCVFLYGTFNRIAFEFWYPYFSRIATRIGCWGFNTFRAIFIAQHLKVAYYRVRHNLFVAIFFTCWLKGYIAANR